jgi:hypothetical protein
MPFRHPKRIGRAERLWFGQRSVIELVKDNALTGVSDNAMLSIEKSSIHDVFVRLNRNDPVAVDICGSSLRKHGQTVLDVTFIDLGWRRPAKSGLWFVQSARATASMLNNQRMST